MFFFCDLSYLRQILHYAMSRSGRFAKFICFTVLDSDALPVNDDRRTNIGHLLWSSNWPVPKFSFITKGCCHQRYHTGKEIICFKHFESDYQTVFARCRYIIVCHLK